MKQINEWDIQGEFEVFKKDLDAINDVITLVRLANHVMERAYLQRDPVTVATVATMLQREITIQRRKRAGTPGPR